MQTNRRKLTANTDPSHDWFYGDELVECVQCGCRSYSYEARTRCTHPDFDRVEHGDATSEHIHTND